VTNLWNKECIGWFWYPFAISPESNNHSSRIRIDCDEKITCLLS
jgi:hypothetical protein